MKIRSAIRSTFGLAKSNLHPLGLVGKSDVWKKKIGGLGLVDPEAASLVFSVNEL